MLMLRSLLRLTVSSVMMLTASASLSPTALAQDCAGQIQELDSAMSERPDLPTWLADRLQGLRNEAEAKCLSGDAAAAKEALATAYHHLALVLPRD